MSAAVMGKRSSSPCFFEEIQQFLHLHHDPPSPGASNPSHVPFSKRARFCSSSSPVRSFSPPRSSDSSNTTRGNPICDGENGPALLLSHLRSLFPDMDEQLLGRVLEASGHDLDSAIWRLNELRQGPIERGLGCGVSYANEGISTNAQPSSKARVMVDTISSENPSSMNHSPADGSEWVELFVREMTSASDIDDARVRASKVLDFLEKSIVARASAEAAKQFCEENSKLKERVEGLMCDNGILKRAVAIQHEHQKVYDERNQELQHLRQLDITISRAVEDA